MSPPASRPFGVSPMNRRDFLTTSAGVAASAGLARGDEPAGKPLRVGLIGTGWYGKCSLFRLLQVAPGTQVVSLCDVDKKMLADAADLIGRRTKSDKKPRLYHDYRERLKEKDRDGVMVA